jgi:hypothetical protein
MARHYILWLGKAGFDFMYLLYLTTNCELVKFDRILVIAVKSISELLSFNISP